MYYVFDFLQKKNATSDWQFRSPNAESTYWINHRQKKVTSEYPHLKELKEKVYKHKRMVELRAANSKLKDLTTYKEVMKMGDTGLLTSFINFQRGSLTKAFLIDRCKYLEAQYTFLKKKIDKRVQNMKNRQNMEMVEGFVANEDSGEEDETNRPQFHEFVKNPLDIREFSQTLMSDLPPEHILDLLFYNFYDLDILNRVGLGDEVLKLGHKDPLALYLHRLKLKEAGQGLLEGGIDLKQAIINEDEQKINDIVKEALKLVELAEKEGDQQEFFLDQEEIQPMQSYDIGLLNFESKYGKVGMIIKEAVFGSKKKWKRIHRLQQSKEAFLNSLQKAGKAPRKLSTAIKPQTQNRGKRIQSAMPKKDEDNLSFRSRRSVLSQYGRKDHFSLGRAMDRAGKLQMKMNLKSTAKKTGSYFDLNNKPRSSRMSLRGGDSLNVVLVYQVHE